MSGTLRVISLGAGVQSTTMALMAARGEIGPMPDCAIFADTGAEPLAVYRHLDWLERELPFPIYRVSAGNLRDEIVGAMAGKNRMDARPPFFTASGGMLNRQCTQDFKILPITRKVRELIGLRKGARGPKAPVVEQWIGISCDEAIRMKPSRLSYIKHRWPLIETGMHRRHCLIWCEERQYPKPAKSACTFCPYTDNARWRDMKANDPTSFADAVAIDKAIRAGMPGPKRPKGEQWFVHRDRVPLDEVDLSTAEDRGQLNLSSTNAKACAGCDSPSPPPPCFIRRMPTDLLLKPNGFTQPDFDVWYEGKVVGRILEETSVRTGHPTWRWSITQGRPYSIENNGWAATKEEAMAAFAKRWRGE